MNQTKVEQLKKVYTHPTLLYRLLYRKKIKNFQKKLRQIPNKFLISFDDASYKKANPDILQALQRKKFVNALDHFIQFGYQEVKEGKRCIGIGFPFFNEAIYRTYNPAVTEAYKKDFNFSPFNHFLEFTYKNYLQQPDTIIGYFPFDWDTQHQEKFRQLFNEAEYIKANPDVKSAIDKHTFKNGWDHFRQFGIYEVQRAERKIHPKIPKCSEIEYLFRFEDVHKAVQNKLLTSPYEHFLFYGYTELLEGTRTLPEKNIYSYNMPTLTEEIVRQINAFQRQPLISIVMPVYNVDPKWLSLAIDSIQNQWYQNWELCIVDDASTHMPTKAYLSALSHPQIKTMFLPVNQGISGASNQALKLAEGEYIALMDNDDELTPDAFYEVVKAINGQEAEFIYSDEDKLEMDGIYSDPHFKPDFAPDMFLSQNYLSHLGVIKKELIEKVGGWEIGLEGAQDYDLYLKVLEHTDKIYHIPKVLYHWRKIPGSTAAEYSDKSYAQEAGQKALKNAMRRRKIDAHIKNGKYPGTYKVEYPVKDKPLISIVIPFKDKPELLKMSIESVLNRSSYGNYEIIGISNNSEENKTFEEMKRLERLDSRVKFYEYNIPFNYAKINNYAVNAYAGGKHIVFMNNDIKIITPNWIEEMLMFSQRDNIGAVGAKLYYPNDTIQHAGVTMGVLTLAGHNFKHHPKEAPAYMGRESVIQNVSAVTAALLMVKKNIFEEVGGFDDINLKVAFNDIDFCLTTQIHGYFNLFTPWAEAYHYESISRGADDTPEKQERFKKEVLFMQNKWQKILTAGDPYYNTNLTLDREDFSTR